MTRAVIAAGTFLALGAIVEFAVHNEADHLHSIQQQNLYQAAGKIRALIESRLNATLHLVSGLDAYIKATRGKFQPAELKSLLAGLFTQGKHVRNIGLAPGNRLTYIYPLQGNEGALGLYYPNVPSQWPAIERVIRQHKPVLAGPLVLAQGGTGIIYRLPVYFADTGYWGIISTVIDSEQLLAFIEPIASEAGISIALRGKDGLGAEGKPFYGQQKIFDNNTLTMEVNIPGGVWQLAARTVGAPALMQRLQWWRFAGWAIAIALSALAFLLLRSWFQQKDLTHSLQTSETRFRDMFVHSPIAYQSLDRNGCFLDVNDRMCELLGYSREELLGESFGEFWVERARPGFRKALSCFIEKGEAHGEPELQHKNGKIISVMLEGRVQHDRHGHFLRTHCALYDVTERKQMEAALALSESRLRAAQSIAKLGHWTWDVGSGEITWSDEIYHIFGEEPGKFEPSFKKFSAFVHPEDAAAVHQNADSVTRSDNTHNIDHRIVLASGEVRWVHQEARRSCDEHNELLSVIGTLQDVTERKHNETVLAHALEVAESASRTKSDFLASISHELRTPLNAVIGFSQLLNIDDSLSEDAREYSGEIARGGEILLGLVNDLLDLSQIETGKLLLSVKPLSVQQLLTESMALVAPMARIRHITLHTGDAQDHTETRDVTVHTDYLRLRQVITNLLSNAIKYNHASGKVNLWHELRGDTVRILVRDTGRGIPKDKQARVFNAFDRLGAERTTIEGTGIGLVITRRIVDAMKGAIGFESKEGRGSTFWIDLPLQKSAEVNAPLQEPEAGKSGAA